MTFEFKSNLSMNMGTWRKRIAHDILKRTKLYVACGKTYKLYDTFYFKNQYLILQK